MKVMIKVRQKADWQKMCQKIFSHRQEKIQTLLCIETQKRLRLKTR